jgi:hypothetical protein
MSKLNHIRTHPQNVTLHFLHYFSRTKAANAVGVEVSSSLHDDTTETTTSTIHHRQDINQRQQQQQQHQGLRIRGLNANELLHEKQNRDLQEIKYPKTILGECMAGTSCTVNADCEPGLHCSATNTTLLKKYGLDPVKAYCDTNAGTSTQNVCFRKSTLWNYQRCYRNIAPKPLDTCPSDTAKRSCSVGPVVCCRTLKRIDPNGRKICNPRKCTYSRTCGCSDTKNWACTFHTPLSCETGCYN